MKPARSDRFLRMIASAALATALAASAASAMGPAGTAAAADAAGVAAATGAAAAARAHCDRACLYAILDRYLDALVAHDPSRLSWSPHVKYTENNVALRVGDGLWGSTLGFDKFAVRFADPQTGDIGYDGIVREADAASPFALRLKVVAGAVAEAEAIVARPKEAGIAFVNTVRTPIPSLEAILPPSERSSRARMIALADGYFSTLQQNDGHLHTVFDPDCNRNEDGFQTTNHPGTPYGFIMGLGCAEQFRLGFYRFDDRVRDRLPRHRRGAGTDLGGRLHRSLRPYHRVPAHRRAAGQSQHRPSEQSLLPGDIQNTRGEDSASRVRFHLRAVPDALALGGRGLSLRMSGTMRQ